MQIDEFINATSRLEKYYDKEYTTEQRKIMFDELQNLSIERYKQLISTLIRKSKFLPKVADFAEVNMETPYMKQDETQKTECKKCNSTGYLIYTKIIKDGNRNLNYQYACLCNCGNAEKYEGWNTSDKRYRSNYYTPYAEEIGLKI